MVIAKTQLAQMATENIHPSEELRGILQQTTKRKLLYTAAILSIEEEVALVKHLQKAKVISSAEEHECGAEMPMSHRLHPRSSRDCTAIVTQSQTLVR
jgi:hypothetical protein